MMDSHITSLSLALDQHEVNNSASPLPDTEDGEIKSCQFDDIVRSPSYLQPNDRATDFFAVSDQRNLTEEYDNSYEKLTYETAQKLFIHLSNKDSIVRQAGLNILSQSVFHWLHIDQTPKRHCSDSFIPEYEGGDAVANLNFSRMQISTEFEVQNSEEPGRIVRQALASLLRLSIRCPFQDVRETCSAILLDLKERNIEVPAVVSDEVSRFIPHDQIKPADTDDEQTFSLYEESFIHNCRLEHMVMVMGMHPQYLQQFLNTNFHLLQSQGALSYQFRSYIGIMAAARHRCTYLVHLMEAHFLLQGGDRKWLQGLEFAPSKLHALSTLNKLLAHRPWLVTPNHIKELVEGGNQYQMSVPELAQAVILMCHFHGAAIFCHGSGINLEIDHEEGHVFHSQDSAAIAKPSSHYSSGSSSPVGDQQLLDQNGDIEVLMERMKQLREAEEDFTREELTRRFEREKEEASHGLLPSGVSGTTGASAYCARFVIDSKFSYQDFAKRDEAAEIPTFKALDYNWGDNACLVVRKYYSEVADLLDDKFDTVYNLTYKTLATKDNVDTTTLRGAIWKYIHCMFGIMHDDYNYGEVNQLIERPLKDFIRTVSCSPEKTTRKMYDAFWKQFRHSEKVHVNIMLMEARMQVGLLYGMRAISEYLRDN